MGISVSMAAGVIFVTAIISFGIVWYAEDAKERVVEEARRDNVKRNRELLDTSVAFVNTSYFAAPSNIVSMNVSNNGSTVIDLRYTDVYLNGTHYNKTYIVSDPTGQAMTNTDIWGPMEIVNITVDLTSAPLDLPVKIKLCCPNGISIYETIE